MMTIIQLSILKMVKSKIKNNALNLIWFSNGGLSTIFLTNYYDSNSISVSIDRRHKKFHKIEWTISFIAIHLIISNCYIQLRKHNIKRVIMLSFFWSKWYIVIQNNKNTKIKKKRIALFYRNLYWLQYDFFVYLCILFCFIFSVAFCIIRFDWHFTLFVSFRKYLWLACK